MLISYRKLIFIYYISAMQWALDLTDEEYEMLLEVTTSGGTGTGILTREAFDEYSHSVGRKITKSELQSLLNVEDNRPEPERIEVNQWENVEEGGQRAFIVRSRTNSQEIGLKLLQEKLHDYIANELKENKEAPFGISQKVISKKEWQKLISHEAIPGAYLTRYLCGVMRANDVSKKTVVAINRAFFLRDNDRKEMLDLTPSAFDDLIREKIGDKNLDFYDTFDFLLGINNFTNADAKRIAKHKQLKGRNFNQVSFAESILSSCNEWNLPVDEKNKLLPDIAASLRKKALKAYKHSNLFAEFIRQEIESNSATPFGIPPEAVSPLQWQQLINREIVPGQRLRSYLGGMLIVNKHYRDKFIIDAIDRGFLACEGIEDSVEITSEMFAKLFRERLEDNALNLQQTLKFAMCANDNTINAVAHTAQVHNSDINELFKKPYYAPIAALLTEKNPLKLPVDATGKVAPDIANIIWTKARASALKSHYPLISKSEGLVKVTLEGVQAAYEAYEMGRCTKAELPLLNEIMDVLITVSPLFADKEYRRSGPKKSCLNGRIPRLTDILQKKIIPNHNEILEFCRELDLPDPEETAKLLEKLPSARERAFDYFHPSYVVNHPEHYETLGSWLKAMRKSSNLGKTETARLLSNEETYTSHDIKGIEERKSKHDFRKYGGGADILENILDKNPYGCFPLDEEDKRVTDKFRRNFWKLAEPGVMKAQYEAEQQWITQSQLLRELSLRTDRPLLQTIIRKWYEATKELPCDCYGSVQHGIDRLEVKRDEQGELRFHRSALDKLKSDPDIKAHISRQQANQLGRG